MLTLREISISYGPSKALRAVSLTVEPGEIVAVLGPNGSGKTSLLHGLAGLVPARGRMKLDQQDLERLTTVERVNHGIILCPEGRQLFSSLTVEENLYLGATRLHRPWRRLMHQQQFLLDLFPLLGERLHQPAGTLSGGEQQMVALARALVADPRVLLLDEPTLGLAPKVAREVLSVLPTIASRGVAILLVEQNLRAAVAVAHRSLFLKNGQIGPDESRRLPKDLSSLLLEVGHES